MARKRGKSKEYGNLIYTTAEIVVVEAVGIKFRREVYPKAGYKELKIEGWE